MLPSQRVGELAGGFWIKTLSFIEIRTQFVLLRRCILVFLYISSTWSSRRTGGGGRRRREGEEEEGADASQL
jgi:hypothetical protein